MVKGATPARAEAAHTERSDSATFQLTEMSLVKYQIVGVAN